MPHLGLVSGSAPILRARVVSSCHDFPDGGTLRSRFVVFPASQTWITPILSLIGSTGRCPLPSLSQESNTIYSIGASTSLKIGSLRLHNNGLIGDLQRVKLALF